VVSECSECNVCDCTGRYALAMAGSNSVSSDAPDTPPVTVVGIREMVVSDKLQKLQKVRLLELVQVCIAHITLLESEKDKAPANVSDVSDVLKTELRKLKVAVFVNSTGANAHEIVPVGLTQGYWDTGDRSDISWEAIHKLAAEPNGTPVARNEDATPWPPTQTRPPSRPPSGGTTPQSRPSWPSGSSWPSLRPCGACRPSPR
jgi:hypothetical protein